MNELAASREQEIDTAFKEAYEMYLIRVDMRDMMMPNDPARPIAQAAVDASGEMFFLLSKLLRPYAGEPAVGG